MVDIRRRPGGDDAVNIGSSIQGDTVHQWQTYSYFIGGSPCSGKSTAAQALARAHRLQYYDVDAQERAHVALANAVDHPIMASYARMSWDEVWMRAVKLQVNEEFQFYRERWQMVEADLNEFVVPPPVISEGAAYLPELLVTAGIPPERAIFMVATWDFQWEHYQQRPFIHGILAQCREPEQAFRNWMQRDYEFGQQTAAAAERLGYAVLTVDGRCSQTETIHRVAEHLGLTFP